MSKKYKVNNVGYESIVNEVISKEAVIPDNIIRNVLSTFNEIIVDNLKNNKIVELPYGNISIKRRNINSAFTSEYNFTYKLNSEINKDLKEYFIKNEIEGGNK